MNNNKYKMLFKKRDDFNYWCLNYNCTSYNCKKKHSTKVCSYETKTTICKNPYCTYIHKKRPDPYKFIKDYEEFEKICKMKYNLNQYDYSDYKESEKLNQPIKSYYNISNNVESHFPNYRESRLLNQPINSYYPNYHILNNVESHFPNYRESRFLNQPINSYYPNYHISNNIEPHLPNNIEPQVPTLTNFNLDSSYYQIQTNKYLNESLYNSSNVSLLDKDNEILELKEQIKTLTKNKRYFEEYDNSDDSFIKLDDKNTSSKKYIKLFSKNYIEKEKELERQKEKELELELEKKRQKEKELEKQITNNKKNKKIITKSEIITRSKIKK